MTMILSNIPARIVKYSWIIRINHSSHIHCFILCFVIFFFFIINQVVFGNQSEPLEDAHYMGIWRNINTMLVFKLYHILTNKDIGCHSCYFYSGTFKLQKTRYDYTTWGIVSPYFTCIIVVIIVDFLDCAKKAFCHSSGKTVNFIHIAKYSINIFFR